MDALTVAGVVVGVAAIIIILPSLLFICLRHKEDPMPGVGPSPAHRNWHGAAALDPLLQPDWAKQQAARNAKQPQQLVRMLSQKGAAAATPQHKGARASDEAEAWRLAALRIPSTLERHGLPSYLKKQLSQGRRVVPGMDRYASSTSTDVSRSPSGACGMAHRATSHVSGNGSQAAPWHAFTAPGGDDDPQVSPRSTRTTGDDDPRVSPRSTRTTGGGGAQRLLAAPEPALLASVIVVDPQPHAQCMGQRPSSLHASSISVHAGSTAPSGLAPPRMAGHNMDDTGMEEGEGSCGPADLRQGAMRSAIPQPEGLAGEGASAPELALALPPVRKGHWRVVPVTGDTGATAGSGAVPGPARTPSNGWTEDSPSGSMAVERAWNVPQHNKGSPSRFARALA